MCCCFLALNCVCRGQKAHWRPLSPHEWDWFCFRYLSIAFIWQNIDFDTKPNTLWNRINRQQEATEKSWYSLKCLAQINSTTCASTHKNNIKRCNGTAQQLLTDLPGCRQFLHFVREHTHGTYQHSINSFKWKERNSFQRKNANKSRPVEGSSVNMIIFWVNWFWFSIFIISKEVKFPFRSRCRYDGRFLMKNWLFSYRPVKWLLRNCIAGGMASRERVTEYNR